MTAKADCRLQQFNDEGKQSCKWSITQYIDSTPCSNNNKTVTCHYPKWQRTQQQQSHTHTHLTTGTGTVQNERNSQCKQTHDNSTHCECDSPNAPWHSVSGHKNTDCATVVHRSCPLATTHDKTSQQSSRNSDAYTLLLDNGQIMSREVAERCKLPRWWVDVHNWCWKADAATICQWCRCDSSSAQSKTQRIIITRHDQITTVRCRDDCNDLLRRAADTN